MYRTYIRNYSDMFGLFGPECSTCWNVLKMCLWGARGEGQRKGQSQEGEGGRCRCAQGEIQGQRRSQRKRQGESARARQGQGQRQRPGPKCTQKCTQKYTNIARERWERCSRGIQKSMTHALTENKRNCSISCSSNVCHELSWPCFLFFSTGKVKEEYEEPPKGKSKGRALTPIQVWLLPPVPPLNLPLNLLRFRGKGKEGKGKSKEEDPPLRSHCHIATSPCQMATCSDCYSRWGSHDILILVEGSRKFHVCGCAYVLLHLSMYFNAHVDVQQTKTPEIEQGPTGPLLSSRS